MKRLKFLSPIFLVVLLPFWSMTACHDTDKDEDSPSDKSSENDGGSDDDTDTVTDGGDAGDNTDNDAETIYVDFIEQQMDEASIPGIAVAITSGGETVWSAGFGYADIEAERLVTPDTPFPIASISKTFIGTALMQLEETGALDLDDDINSFELPFTVEHPYFDDEVISLRYLTSHTSGIIDNEDIYECNYYLESDHTVSLLDFFYPGGCETPPVTDLGAFLQSYLSPGGSLYDANSNFSPPDAGPPGTYFEYSNIGAALAAYAIGTATGTPFDQYCEEEIFKPLHMTDTHWHYVDFDDQTDPVTLYDIVDNKLTALPRYSFTTWPDGGLKTSANDLARFLTTVMNGGVLEDARILPEKKVQQMLASQTSDIAKTGILEDIDFYGTFWLGIKGFIGHTGGDPGVTTFMLFSPEDRIGIVVLINMDGEPIANREEGLILETLQFGYTFLQD